MARPGIGGLAGRTTGRPPTQTAPGGPKKVSAWLGPATQQLRRWIPRLRRAFGVKLHISTLRRLARRAGYAWKRCRRSLRAQRDPAAFAACQARLRELHRAEARGELAVVYVDECRFSRQAPVPYAWQRRGQPPVALPAVRGSGGHSVLGFWQAHAPGQPLQAYVRAGSLTADLFVLAVHDFAQTLNCPTVLVLDNASIHRALVVRACLAEWADRGLTLLFLPPYSPELNHIELLWHRCKHYWVRPEDYQSDHTLLQRVEYVLNRVGRNYTVSFA
ncbi:IS630 family transposase [Hymenobacter rubripertinctus]|uniref:IS630 family transposase n=1 Tax=Hymenobacter rubripertinctus TaxID=2029981 RepID=UPI001603E359|nr:IS630 family transposase [Hymenobacter rubripertinctus]